MRKLTASILLTATMAFGGCAFFNRVKTTTCPNPQACANTILNDFKWGVDQAGTQLWLSADDVARADAYVLVGLDTVASTPNDWKKVVESTLNSIKEHVTEADKWKPYIDAALLVLSVSK